MSVTTSLKKYVLPNLPYVMMLWFFDKLGMAYRLAPGADFLKKLTASVGTINTAFASLAPSIHPFDLLVGIAGAGIIYGIVWNKKRNAKKYRKDVEYGSARWSA